VDYFTEWPEACVILDQEASTVADALLTNFFYRFGIPRELHSDQGRNFESRLLQEILQRLGVSKTPSTSLHPQSHAMVERYIKSVEELLRKVIAFIQRDWDARLPPSPLAYGASTHDATDLTPASLVFGREVHLQTRSHQQSIMRQIWWTLCTKPITVPPTMPLASDRMRTQYDKLATERVTEKGKARGSVIQPARKGNRLSSSPIWRVHTRRSTDSVTWWNSRPKVMVVHLDRLAPYHGAGRDEQP
jgi:hypothetical protein